MYTVCVCVSVCPVGVVLGKILETDAIVMN